MFETDKCKLCGEPTPYGVTECLHELHCLRRQRDAFLAKIVRLDAESERLRDQWGLNLKDPKKAIDYLESQVAALNTNLAKFTGELTQDQWSSVAAQISSKGLDPTTIRDVDQIIRRVRLG